MHPFRALILALLVAASLSAESATVLVMRFQNSSAHAELNWIGESIAETLRADFGLDNQIVSDRSAGVEAMRKLGLRPEANFTKASIIRLAQALEADFVVFGNYNVKLAAGVTQLKDGTITIAAQFVDLRKMQGGPDLTETSKLSELSRYKEHLAWQALAYVNPRSHTTFDQFLASRKLTRLDAEESYIHGLLTTDKEKGQKWFLQAVNLDPKFISPAFELGKLYLERKDPKQALRWLQTVPASDTRYTEARFRMGIAAYDAGNFGAAVLYFKEVANAMPLNEVYNNLAAAEDQLNLPPAIDDFRHALEGDPTDATYLFNLGAALLRRNLFEEAQQKLQAVIDNSPDDPVADKLLERAEGKEISPSNAKPLVPARLKTAMDSTAFRQLKAMLQPKVK